MLKTDTGHTRTIHWVFVALFVVVLTLALWQIRQILLLTLAAVMLTVFASMPVRYLVNRGMSRGLAILVSVLGGFALVILMILLVFPTLIQQFSVLFTEIIPLGLQRLIERWNSGELIQQTPLLQQIPNIQTTIQGLVIDENLLNQVVGQIGNALSQFGGSVIPLIGDVASAILSLLIIIFLCMYFIAEPDRYIEGVVRLSPIWYRRRMREILGRLDDTIRAWLRVTGVSMLITGVGTAIGLALLGIQQWAALGVLAGILSFIPNFGPIAALIPSVAVAIIQAPQNTLLVIIIIYGVSFVQSQVIGPIMARESMKIAPVMILIGQVVFGIFFGFLGIMLAVPLTAMMLVLVQEIYVKDILGDTGEGRKPVIALDLDSPMAETD
jgi:predicted PurR-regulated permease PerM